MNDMYMHKYHKYKTKYLELQDGGFVTTAVVTNNRTRRRPPPRSPPRSPPRPPSTPSPRTRPTGVRSNRKGLGAEFETTSTDPTTSSNSRWVRAERSSESQETANSGVRIGASAASAASAEPEYDERLMHMFDEVAKLIDTTITDAECCDNDIVKLSKTPGLDDAQKKFLVQMSVLSGEHIKNITSIGYIRPDNRIQSTEIDDHMDKYYSDAIHEIKESFLHAIGTVYELALGQDSGVYHSFAYAGATNLGPGCKMGANAGAIDCLAMIGFQYLTKMHNILGSINEAYPSSEIIKKSRESFEKALREFNEMKGKVDKALINVNVSVTEGEGRRKPIIRHELAPDNKNDIIGAINESIKGIESATKDLDPKKLRSIRKEADDLIRIISRL